MTASFKIYQVDPPVPLAAIPFWRERYRCHCGVSVCSSAEFARFQLRLLSVVTADSPWREYLRIVYGEGVRLSSVKLTELELFYPSLLPLEQACVFKGNSSTPIKGFSRKYAPPDKCSTELCQRWMPLPSPSDAAVKRHTLRRFYLPGGHGGNGRGPWNRLRVALQRGPTSPRGGGAVPPVPSGGWVEVTRTHAMWEALVTGYGCWTHPTTGSGYWANVGRTIAFEDGKEAAAAIRTWLGLLGC